MTRLEIAVRLLAGMAASGRDSAYLEFMDRDDCFEALRVAQQLLDMEEKFPLVCVNPKCGHRLLRHQGPCLDCGCEGKEFARSRPLVAGSGSGGSGADV